ncbi:MAG: PIN domain-containing protein [Candidatus Aenigmarchaeota archaeon]|nr:PIN domain-containing protein [Candidatus Aenigmarchaeota archaeon]
MKVILDTNFLMAVVQFKIDVFFHLSGNELYVIEPVVSELESLSQGKSKDATAARIALQLIKTKKLKILKSESKADAALVEYSKKGYSIATQDKILRDKIKKANGKSIYIRQKKYVIL